MLAAVLAFKAMKDATGDIPVNVIWVWEGEEEIGCPHLLQFVRKKFAELDRADAFWMPSMTQDTEGVMRVDRGSKGTVKIEIRIKGGEWGGTRSGKDLWSANLPLVDAPMWRMVRALDSMVDNGDRLIVDGIQDLVRPRDAEEIEELAVLKDHLDEQELMDSLGIARFKRGQPAAELYEDFLMAPMVNVVGIVGGYTGPKVFTTLPMDVVAKLDFRLTPNVLADNVPRLLRAHLDRRGFNEVEIEVLGGYDYSRTPASDPIYQAAFEAARRHACPYRVYPTTPAVAPFGMFNLRPLAKPAVFVGMGHGARAHAADEYITVEGIRDFMKYAVTFLHVWAAL
jgi:acetylornithine deacetylase/succinyl-diaminopimelate desuccinylase-like protein